MKFKTIYFFTYIILFVQLLSGMDSAMVRENKRLAWETVLLHGTEWLSHDMIVSLAVSKEHDALLCKTAKERKHYVKDKTRADLNKEEFIWHKYGTACGRAQNLSCHNQLLFDRYHLAGDGQVERLLGAWGNFYGCLPNDSRGFFNDRGDFCFHGYGNIPQMGGKHIIEYSLPSGSKQKALRCITDVSASNPGLSLLLDFPLLLKAFLNSLKVKEVGSMPNAKSMRVKMYCIDGVTIPENYMAYKRYSSELVYKTFSDLPEQVKNNILMRKVAYKK